jgi:hypothetical protein
MNIKFLNRFLKKHSIPDTIENKKLVSELYPYDPSSNKKYLHWLYKRFIGEVGGYDNVRYFDHDYWDNVRSSLILLDNYPERFRNASFSTDIYSYSDTDKLTLGAEKSFHRTNKKINLKNDIDLVDEFDGIIILYPSTAEASCYYGRGTKWCITDNSTYEDYTETGYLFFILNKSSNNDDYKSALYIDAFGIVKGFDSVDHPLNVSFGDVEKIDFNEYNGAIIYPKRVAKSIKKYIDTKAQEKPLIIYAKVFNNWVKSLGLGYKAKISDIEESKFYLFKKVRAGLNSNVGEYIVADNEKLNDLIYDIDEYDILNSSKTKTNNLIKVVGENKILRYFSWDDLFNDILMNSSRFRFFNEYDIDNLTDAEIEKSPEINDLKKEFMEDPVGFYDENKYKGTGNQPPKYSNIDGLLGMLFIYDNYFDIDRLVKDYPEYCLDAKAKPIVWKYEGKKYYIMNTKEDNKEIYD